MVSTYKKPPNPDRGVGASLKVAKLDEKIALIEDDCQGHSEPPNGRPAAVLHLSA